MKFYNEDDVEHLLRSQVSNDAAVAFNKWLADFSGEVYREGFTDGEGSVDAYA